MSPLSIFLAHLTPGSRRRLQAHAKVCLVAIVEASFRGERSQPGPHELDRIAQQLQRGHDWKDLFPGVASLRLDTSGTGLAVSLRLTKTEGEAVHLVPESTPGATVMAIKRVNELDYYSLGLMLLAEKTGLSVPRTLAVVKELRLQEDDDYYKVFRFGKSEHKRYSAKALDRLRKELPELDMDDIWDRNKPVPKSPQSALAA